MKKGTQGHGQTDPADQIEHGKIVSGADGGDIVVEQPVPLKQQMAVGEKTRRAMALKLAGASYANIATQLGYSDASGARKAVMRGMKSAQQENSGELRKIHYGRLEHMLMLLWPDVNNRDLASMGMALGVMDRMEKLYGLNAAEKVEFSASKETVILADGDKDSYLAALEEAGKEITTGGESGSSKHSDVIDIDDNEPPDSTHD